MSYRIDEQIDAALDEAENKCDEIIKRFMKPEARTNRFFQDMDVNKAIHDIGEVFKVLALDISDAPTRALRDEWRDAVQAGSTIQGFEEWKIGRVK